MSIETNICIKRTYNSFMGVECWSNPNTIFYIDKNDWIKVGDEVKCERDDNGFYRKVWVNGILKTNSNFDSIHSKI